MAKHVIFGGKVHLYKRPNSRFWQCSTYLAGHHRQSTKKESLEQAVDFAEDWYLGLKLQHRAGELKSQVARQQKDEKTFRAAAKLFQREFAIIAAGNRSPKYVELLDIKLRVHLIPYFGDMPVAAITPGTLQEYRMYRAENGYRGKPPGPDTMAHELIAFRQVMKTAHRHRWIPMMPDFSDPFKKSEKVSHRAWFSPGEYRLLYKATRERAKNPKKKYWQWQSEQLHDYVLFMANTGLRPDEARRLQYRDVTIVKDIDTKQVILEIDVRGKTGVGHCKSTANAVRPFRRLCKRNNYQPTDLIFPGNHRALFNNILDELNLKLDRDGRRRTACSLRHSYICFRLNEGADIYQIAKNCRTSVEMIQKHYAAHIKNAISAAAVNVRRSKPTPPKGEPRSPTT